MTIVLKEKQISSSSSCPNTTVILLPLTRPTVSHICLANGLRSSGCSTVGIISHLIVFRPWNVLTLIFFSEVALGKRVKPLSWDLFVTRDAGVCPSEKLAIKYFTDHQGRPYVKSYDSIARYVLGHLDISDVCPSSCNPDRPLGSIERVLSFVLHDTLRLFRREDPLYPSWRCREDPICESAYFSGASLYTGEEGKHIIDKATAFVPYLLIQKQRGSTQMSEATSAICDSGIFDEFHYGKTGRFYTELVAINHSTLPQPRRTTMSVTITPPRRINAANAGIQDLNNYSAAGRPPADWRSRPMPPEIAQLGEYLWKRLWHHISPVSRVCPPTNCQLLLCSSSLKAVMCPHKDNEIVTDDGSKQTRTGTDKSLNSQIIGTSAIVKFVSLLRSLHETTQPRRMNTSGTRFQKSVLDTIRHTSLTQKTTKTTCMLHVTLKELVPE